MRLPVVLRPEAADDLHPARDWYEYQKGGLGGKFAAQVSLGFEPLASMPELFAADWRNVRACQIRRFPYVIYYRVLADRIEVLTVPHGGRDPSVGQSRV